MPLVRVCLKCERRILDDESKFSPCVCGVNLWAVVPVPEKDYKVSVTDAAFLKSIRVLPEV